MTAYAHPADFTNAAPAFTITDTPNGLIHLTPLCDAARWILTRWSEGMDGELLVDEREASHIIECLELHDLFGVEA